LNLKALLEMRYSAGDGFIVFRFELFACRERFICTDPLFRVMNCRCELKAALRTKAYMFTSPFFPIQNSVMALIDIRSIEPVRERRRSKQPIWIDSIEQLPASAGAHT
jgi:hypothetical protein